MGAFIGVFVNKLIEEIWCAIPAPIVTINIYK